MKVKMFLFLVLIISLLSGCWRYGTGETLGYITTIESGFFWDLVWIRAELESSQTDAYCIRKNSPLKKELLETSKRRQRVKLSFYNHVATASMQSLMQSAYCEIIAYEIIGNCPNEKE